MAGSPSPRDMFPYEPPASIWSLIEQHTPQHEREELKNMLGESLVDESVELHQEVGTLIEIWRDFREASNQEQPKHTRFPEPPEARDRLKQEICFFVENIREKAKYNGRDPEKALSSHNTQVLDYVLQEKRTSYSPGPGSSGYGSRPSTARSSRDGRETPCRTSRRGTPDRISLESTLSEDVESMNDKLNILKIDEVTSHLRMRLQEEIEFLQEDIEFLQRCLEDEADCRDMIVNDTEPTLAELREERGKLERDLLTPDVHLPDALREKPKPQPPIKMMSSPLSGSSTKSLRPAPPSSNNRGSPTQRSTPIKASHHAQVLKVDHSDSPDVSKENQHVPRRRSSSGRRPTVVENNVIANSAHVEGVTHVTIRTGDLPKSAKIVKVASISTSTPVDGPSGSDTTVKYAPSPPSASKPASGRPGSANRFRKMVLECREGT